MSFPFYAEFGVRYPKYIPPKDPSERLVDPKKKLAPACTTKCSRWVHEYAACCDRVKARTDGRGNCSGQFEELQACVDTCFACPVCSRESEHRTPFGRKCR